MTRRTGFEKAKDELRSAANSSEVSRQQVIDFRGGNLLTARSEVDPKRIAYAGHSFDAPSAASFRAWRKASARSSSWPSWFRRPRVRVTGAK